MSEDTCELVDRRLTERVREALAAWVRNGARTLLAADVSALADAADATRSQLGKKLKQGGVQRHRAARMVARLCPSAGELADPHEIARTALEANSETLERIALSAEAEQATALHILLIRAREVLDEIERERERERAATEACFWTQVHAAEAAGTLRRFASRRVVVDLIERETGLPYNDVTDRAGLYRAALDCGAISALEHDVAAAEASGGYHHGLDPGRPSEQPRRRRRGRRGGARRRRAAQNVQQ